MANFREFMALRTAFETLIKTLAHILDLVKLFALIYDVNSPQCHFQAFHIVNAFIQNALLTIIFTLSQSFFIFHSCVVSKILSQKLHVRLFFEYSDSVIVERWKAKVVSWILALAEQKKEWISCYQSIIQPRSEYLALLLASFSPTRIIFSFLPVRKTGALDVSFSSRFYCNKKRRKTPLF